MLGRKATVPAVLLRKTKKRGGCVAKEEINLKNPERLLLGFFSLSPGL